ncbi:MAG: cytidylyltransferase domain-containing protein [Jejuia sp.]
MKNIVIIPARGGSKRLPKKNIRQLGGIPLIVHSIEYAKKNAALIQDIYVTTDNAEIKELSRSLNVNVIERPQALSGDRASTVSALKHILESVKVQYDNVILLQPTNPLRPKNLLNEALQKFTTSNFDSLMTVSPNEKKLGKIKNNKFVPYSYSIGQRSQDLEPLYYENGLLYISKSNIILENIILGENNVPFITKHPYASVDIDTIEDLDYAEFILNKYPNE